MNPTTDAAINLGEELGHDIAAIAQNIMNEREPIRHARMMNHLLNFLERECKQNNSTPEQEVSLSLSELPEVQQKTVAAVLRDRMGLPQLAQQQTSATPDAQAKESAAPGSETKTETHESPE